MSNDPKDTVVNWSILTNGQRTTPTPNPISTGAPGMITTCNEGTNLIGLELSNLASGMIGQENFNRDCYEGKKKTE